MVVCPSYAAKARGIKRGMSVFEAKKVCPDVIVLPSDYETYSVFSSRLFTIIRRFTPEVEEYSIDEAFCDITGLRRLYRSSYENIALCIKEAVEKELGLTVSVGLSSSKSLAKICSKYKKPAGFTAAPGYRLHDFLPKILLGQVCGFGPNTVALLNKHSLTTVMDFVKKERTWAQKVLGKIGLELHQELQGLSVYPVSTQVKQKYLSISKTRTFTPGSSDRDFVRAQLMRNLELALAKARRFKLASDRIAVYLKKKDHTIRGVEGFINRFSSSINDFSGIVSDLFDMTFNKNQDYRATGVVILRLKDQGVDDRTLFDDPVRIVRYRHISETIDLINHKYGSSTIHSAASLSSRKEKYARADKKYLNIPILKLS